MAGTKAFDPDAAEEAAMLVFWERGYADSSLDTLGAAMGLGRSSFYNAFGSKSALFARCLSRYGSRYGDRYERALASHPDGIRGALDAFFDVTLDRIVDPAVPRGCLIAQSVMGNSTLPEAVARQASGQLGLQGERLRRAFIAAGVGASEADDLALQLAAVNQSLAVLSRTDLDDARLRFVARRAVDDVTRGLADPARVR